ncbi:MAG TPA: NADH-quinone oxidoreductase subunit M [Chromatiales bacterium]|nr:NADH-quinone oxidoreductase subunit M [Chromatiales bacterium]
MVFSEMAWPTQAGYPILTTLQLLPLLAAGLMLWWRDSERLKLGGLLLMGVELGIALDLYWRYDAAQVSMQFAEHLSLLGPLDYHAAVDGVSILFILLTALLILLASVYGLVRGLGPSRRFLSVMLAIESALMSLFATVNLLWFAVLSVVQIGLVGYLLWRWATSPEKDFALSRFYQFMGVAVLLLAAGTLVLGWNHAHATGRWSFDLFDLTQVPVPGEYASLVFFLLFYGMAIRTPLFPLHGWLPLVAEHGNIAVAPTTLLGLKLGIYGMLRFVFPVVPEAVDQWHYYVVAFAVVGIFYAASLAMMQDNMRRLLAFAVVSHTGLIVIGLFTLHQMAFEGAVILSVTFGLAISTLMFMTGMIYRRTGTTLLHKLGGLFDQIPFLGVTFLVAGLAIIGMPGTPGFDAVHLVMEASIHRFGGLLTIAAALGNVVAAGFLLWAFQRIFLAPPVDGAEISAERTTQSEMLVAGLIVLVLLSAGFYSEPWLELIEKPLQELSALYSHE